MIVHLEKIKISIFLSWCISNKDPKPKYPLSAAKFLERISRVPAAFLIARFNSQQSSSAACFISVHARMHAETHVRVSDSRASPRTRSRCASCRVRACRRVYSAATRATRAQAASGAHIWTPLSLVRDGDDEWAWRVRTRVTRIPWPVSTPQGSPRIRRAS